MSVAIKPCSVFLLRVASYSRTVGGSWQEFAMRTGRLLACSSQHRFGPLFSTAAAVRT